MALLRQPSFAGGELGEGFWGRTDMARHAVGVRYARDFLVTKTGALQNRGGFRYLGPALNTGYYRSRLTPFIVSDTKSYVLEWCHYTLRVWANGALVYSGGAPLLLATPYPAGQLAALRFVQSGDVLTLTHPAVPPHELKRTSETSWALTDRNAPLRPPYFPGYTPALLQPLPLAGTTENPAREWRYAVTTLGVDSDGTGWESSPYEVSQAVTRTLEGATYTYSFAPVPTQLSVSTTTPLWVIWHTYYEPPTEWPTSFRLLGWRVYRGRGGLFGFIGQTREFSLLDVGDEPDYAQPPPKGLNPFEVYEYDNENPYAPGTLARTEYPSTCAYHGDRLWLGGTVQRPATLWGSTVGDYSNFDARVPSTDDETVEVTLASRRREAVRWLASREDLLIGTSENVWALSAADGGHVVATQPLYARVETTQGCAAVEPVQVGDSILFVGAKGEGLHSLHGVENKRAWAVDDLGLWAPHLATSILEMAYTEEDSVVWALRTDGNLVALTYSRAQELAAWTLHETPGGHIESICAVPEGGRDVLYVSVLRWVKEANGSSTEVRNVERLEPHRDEATYGVFLDSSTVSSATNATVTGLQHLRGLDVYAVVNGAPFGPLTVPQSGVLPLPEAAQALPQSVVVVGLPYVPSLETLDAASAQAELSTRKKVVASVSFEVVASAGLWAGERLAEAHNFSEWQQREVQHGYALGPLHTGLVTLPLLSTWNTGGRAALQQRLPLPLTVTGLVREVVLGG